MAPGPCSARCSSIKPVVTLVDGRVEEESKQRTRARSLRYLADKAKDSPPISRLAVCNGAAPDIEEVLAMLADVPTEHPLVVTDLGPVVGHPHRTRAPSGSAA